MKIISLIIVLSMMSIGCSRGLAQNREFLLLKDKMTRLERKSEVQDAVLIKIKKDLKGLRKKTQERQESE